jgi:hypothetical protein
MNEYGRSPNMKLLQKSRPQDPCKYRVWVIPSRKYYVLLNIIHVNCRKFRTISWAAVIKVRPFYINYKVLYCNPGEYLVKILFTVN